MDHYTLAVVFDDAVADERTAWSARLTVTSDDANYPPKVLVFQAEDPDDPETRGWFTAVAGPAQLEEYPEDAPAQAGEGEPMIPFYRLASVVLISRNASDLQRVIDQVTEELELLEANLTSIITLSAP